MMMPDYLEGFSLPLPKFSLNPVQMIKNIPKAVKKDVHKNDPHLDPLVKEDPDDPIIAEYLRRFKAEYDAGDGSLLLDPAFVLPVALVVGGVGWWLWRRHKRKKRGGQNGRA